MKKIQDRCLLVVLNYYSSKFWISSKESQRLDATELILETSKFNWPKSKLYKRNILPFSKSNSQKSQFFMFIP